jgi:hypothetical protein
MVHSFCPRREDPAKSHLRSFLGGFVRSLAEEKILG